MRRERSQRMGRVPASHERADPERAALRAVTSFGGTFRNGRVWRKETPADTCAPWGQRGLVVRRLRWRRFVKRTLTLLGAGALLLWTGLGAFAWSRVAERVTVVPAEEAKRAREQDEARLLALTDQLGLLHRDVRALADAMGANLQALNDGLLANQDDAADELADLLRELRTLRDAVSASRVPESATLAVQVPLASAAPSEAAPALVNEPGLVNAPAPADEPAPEPAGASPAPRPRRSFLAFKLPSDDFEFAERRSWTLLPALSRVGFDGRTTLHDFTATSSTVEGELEADLSRPADAPRARVSLQAASLVSGDAGRDEAMQEHLAVAQHPSLDFELVRFEPSAIDLAKGTASGKAHGRLSVRGVTREVSMPVRLAIDEARRLCVDGEMSLDLTDFEVPVPSKLGLISMEKVVKVWIALRLRVDPRSEG